MEICSPRNSKAKNDHKDLVSGVPEGHVVTQWVFVFKMAFVLVALQSAFGVILFTIGSLIKFGQSNKSAPTSQFHM